MKNRHGNKKKLPKLGATRFGHLSSKRESEMNKSLAKSGYFADWIKRARKYLSK